MPGELEEELRSLAELLAVFAVLPPILVGATTLSPSVRLLSLPFWLGCLLLDAYSTFRFYMRNPLVFTREERNTVFGWLVKNLGFPLGFLLQLGLVELPVATATAWLMMSRLQNWLFGRVVVEACLAAALLLIGIAHLHASYRNIRMEKGGGK